MNLFESSQDFEFSNLIWLDRPALSKSNSSWDNSYWVRLVIVSLDVNVGRLQFLVSDDSSFCCVFSDF